MKLCIHYTFSNATGISTGRRYLDWKYHDDTPITVELLNNIEKDLRVIHETDDFKLKSLFLTNWQIIPEVADCPEFTPTEL